MSTEILLAAIFTRNVSMEFRLRTELFRMLKNINLEVERDNISGRWRVKATTHLNRTAKYRD
jgi:hypothetical protein